MKKVKCFGRALSALVLLLPLSAAIGAAFAPAEDYPLPSLSYGNADPVKYVTPANFVPALDAVDVEYGRQAKEARTHTDILYQKGDIYFTQADLELGRLNQIHNLQKELPVALEDIDIHQWDAGLFTRTISARVQVAECKRLRLTIDMTFEEAREHWFSSTRLMMEAIEEDPSAENFLVQLWNEHLGVMKGLGMTEAEYADYMANAMLSTAYTQAYFQYFLEAYGYEEKSDTEKILLFHNHMENLLVTYGIVNPYR